eukprot:1184092-Prorocentrum_minimum.AAC.2
MAGDLHQKRLRQNGSAGHTPAPRSDELLQVLAQILRQERFPLHKGHRRDPRGGAVGASGVSCCGLATPPPAFERRAVRPPRRFLLRRPLQRVRGLQHPPSGGDGGCRSVVHESVGQEIGVEVRARFCDYRPQVVALQDLHADPLVRRMLVHQGKDAVAAAGLLHRHRHELAIHLPWVARVRKERGLSQQRPDAIDRDGRGRVRTSDGSMRSRASVQLLVRRRRLDANLLPAGRRRRVALTKVRGAAPAARAHGLVKLLHGEDGCLPTPNVLLPRLARENTRRWRKVSTASPLAKRTQVGTGGGKAGGMKQFAAESGCSSGGLLYLPLVVAGGGPCEGPFGRRGRGKGEGSAVWPVVVELTAVPDCGGGGGQLAPVSWFGQGLHQIRAHARGKWGVELLM